jgi:hypothetical protein
MWPPAVRWSVRSEKEEHGSEERQGDGGTDGMVETRRLELLTLSLQRRCSTS